MVDTRRWITEPAVAGIVSIIAAFLYCLIHAALRCEIDVVLPCAMSNHSHVVVYDRAGH